MLSIFREKFIKDLIIWVLLSIFLSSILAAGAGLLADRYFTQTIAGLMGDVGEYDLFFQVRNDLKGVALSRFKQIIQEKLPGAVLKTGISIAGKTTVFIGLPTKYRTKRVFTNLNYYFRDVPGSSSFSLMTEPRLTISGIPRSVMDLFIREVEKIPDVSFAFQDGSSIAIILDQRAEIKKVKKELEGILASYRLLEVRFPSEYNVENAIEAGKILSSLLAGKGGVTFIRDVTSGESSDERQALLMTMAEMKKFLLSYAGQVFIIPISGIVLNPGDVLALGSNEAQPLKKGEPVKTEDVLVKITSAEQEGRMEGLIVQGDSSLISDPSARLVVEDNKTGDIVASIITDSPKERLVKVLDESIKLLEQVNSIQDLPSQAGQVLAAAETIQAALQSINGLGTGTPDLQKIRRLSTLLEGTGTELQNMADNLARLRWAENQLDKAIDGLEGVQTFTQMGLALKNSGYYGDLGERITSLGQGITGLIEDLRSKAKSLDDFINRFNPLVEVLLRWKQGTANLAEQLNKVYRTSGGEDGSLEGIAELIGMNAESLKELEELDLSGLRQGLTPLESGFGALEGTNLTMIIDELKVVQSSLPKLQDEEIGKTITLLDNYLGGEVASGEKLQLFLNAGYSKKEVTKLIKSFFDSDEVRIQSLPPGTIQTDVRNELSRLLQEVRGVIAALTVIILGIMAFLFDQAPVLAMLHHLDLIAPLEDASLKQRKGIGIKICRKVFPWLYSAAIGAIWLWATIKLSGAQIPYLSDFHFFLAGGFLGIIFYQVVEKFHQLNMDEVMAGYAMGFSFTTVMREILIPAGRPGLMQLLNRRKMVIK